MAYVIVALVSLVVGAMAGGYLVWKVKSKTEAVLEVLK